MNNTVEENIIDVWDHVLDKESANNLSEMMKVIWWQHGHLSRGDIFNPFFHLDCGQTVQDVERSPYKDYILPLWNTIIEKGIAEKYNIKRFRRVYMNAHTHGLEPNIHEDDGDFTMIYYPRMDWQIEWGGGTAVYTESTAIGSTDPSSDVDRYVAYRGNRLLVFDAYLPHQAMPVARECHHLRSIIVFKCFLRNGDEAPNKI